jgi:hypothetical protein
MSCGCATSECIPRPVSRASKFWFCVLCGADLPENEARAIAKKSDISFADSIEYIISWEDIPAIREKIFIDYLLNKIKYEI